MESDRPARARVLMQVELQMHGLACGAYFLTARIVFFLGCEPVFSY